MIEQRVTLRYDAQQIPAIVQAVQGDTGRDVIFELADYEIPTGATANYYIDKPDGNAVYNSAEVISSTEILAHLTEQALAVPGRNNGQVRILSDDEVITSFDFVLEVEAFRGILHLQSETEINIFDAAIQAAVDDAIEEIQAQTPVVTGMQNSIAPSYSASSTYAVGDYVMYNAQLYRCITEIDTAEAWTAAHWIHVPIAPEVSDLKSAFDALKNATTELLSVEAVLEYCNFTSQKIDYWGNGAYQIAYIPCEPNKIYRITKDVDTTRFDIAYIKTTPAVNVPVYGYEELQGTVRATDYVTGDDAAYILVQTKGSPDHVSFFEYIITTNDEQSQEIQNIEDGIQNIENEINGNLTVPIAGSSIIQGTYRSIDGALVANAGRIRTSGFMRMYKGQKLRFEAGMNTTQIFYGYRAVGGTSFTDAAWMGDGDVISIPADWEIILVFRKNASNDDISPADFDATVTIIPSLETDLAEYKAYIKGITDDTVELVSEEKTENITPDLTFTSGYVATDGSIGSASTLKYTNKIAVSPGDVLNVTVIGSEFRFVCAYNDNTPVSDSGAANIATYTVPQGINYVRLTTYTQCDGEPIYHTTTETKYKNIIEPIPMGYMTNAGSMAAGDKLYLPMHNVKNRNRYVFNANITTFSAIKFAKDDSLIVDDTNIVVTNSSGTTTIPHGLTINHDITLIVENEDSYTASLIRVASAGNVFSYTTPIRFLMDENAPYIESQGSTLTECRFSWVSENINQPIWLFGDSYFSWYDVRWTYYASEDGNLESSLLNGYAGQAAASAMTALKNLLQITTPKMVVWCLGMNNGDDSAVNASWYTNYQKLIELSEKYDFEIVLYTTPTTPTIDNSYKNAIVRESGYRYIEADKAVRIDAEGHWVAGALESDNVHPTEIGAKILYYRFLADLPEMMSNK